MKKQLRLVQGGGDAESADGFYRPQQGEQRPDIVDAHVIGQRAALAAEEAEGLAVEGLTAVDMGGYAGHAADEAAVDQLFRGLQPRAQHRVGRDAEVQAPAVRQLHQFAGLGDVRGEHLFRVDVFPSFQHPADDAIVRAGGREVDHQLDFRVGGAFVDAHGPADAVGLGLCLCRLGAAVADRCQVRDGEQLLEVADVDVADHPAAHNGGPDFFKGHLYHSFQW